MPFCRENIGRWRWWVITAPLNHLTLAVMGLHEQEEVEEGRVKTEMPFYTRAPRHSLNLENSCNLVEKAGMLDFFKH